MSDKVLASVAAVCEVLERIAPPSLAAEWDNVGLLAGDPGSAVSRVLVCIDLTADVVAEAIDRSAQVIVAYHPPLFRPVHRLIADRRKVDAHVFDCIAHGIAIYSPHTALDAADGGTNDVLAALCDVVDPQPVEWADTPGERECKLVVFVPTEEVDTVAEAMFAAGAGHIGEYSKCSYRLSGEGTFLGSDATNPTIGAAGRFERVAEIRLESVVPESRVPAVVGAMRTAHSYEEPAFDIYALRRSPTPGGGRCGALRSPVQLKVLAATLKKRLQAQGVQIVGAGDATVGRAICAVGAAGSQVFGAGLSAGDVVVTGEIRHHDALAILRHGACAVSLNHWTSERPVLKPLADRMAQRLPAVDVVVSTADCEPFSAV
jgi:dinuclear metal center YbgI/SA1388 family protein